ncbi:hypothetical protein ELI41_23640 [Rhizobium leguminosarum]|jgi:hypothetical protein|uniref:hypothetical protein n=1 Tax=Rhizobium leguminosarum TaxID=384 RepID=UPI00102F4057|nr:hypothetical protein [Rhizobium leguminosarum]TAU91317.1 hypothetical protein ELI41_23640 [Rhizobium leguminosarum]
MNKKIRVRVQETSRIYIHNDLSNTGYYFQQRIEKRLKEEDREGIGLEMMACLTMMAFALEARINFLGFRLIKDWDEWLPIKRKVKLVSKHLGISADFGKRPYKTVKLLKEFRDTLAHGKPATFTDAREIITTHDELEKRGYLNADWESYVNIEFIRQAAADSDEIWRDLLKLADLNLFETLTQGDRSVQFIEHIEEA